MLVRFKIPLAEEKSVDNSNTQKFDRESAQEDAG
jgi:hypothetical protein